MALAAKKYFVKGPQWDHDWLVEFQFDDDDVSNGNFEADENIEDDEIDEDLDQYQFQGTKDNEEDDAPMEEDPKDEDVEDGNNEDEYSDDENDDDEVVQVSIGTSNPTARRLYLMNVNQN